MDALIKRIGEVKETEIEAVLQAVVRRYGELFPKWEISTVSIYRYEDRNKQIDAMIQFLEQLR